MTASNPTRASLEAALATAKATVMTLEAALAAIDTDGAADELLDLHELKSRFGLGRAGVLGAVERGELVATRGARGRILVARSEAERWLVSRPVQVTRRGAHADNVTDLSDWERRQELALARARGVQS